MQSEKTHNTLQVGYVWRLEKEKWMEELLNIIEVCRADLKYSGISFHIFWKWTYSERFEKAAKMSDSRVIYYGHTPIGEVREHILKLDALIAPSIFLETFWLVACEWLMLGVPVIGPRDGGLADLISSDYALRKDNMVDDSVALFEKMLTGWKGELVEKNIYTKVHWMHNLEKILWVRKNILIIHDYQERVWWAEDYVYFLKDQITQLWRTAHIFWASGQQNKLKRTLSLVLSLFAFWRYFQVKKLISFHNPDLIWLHSIHRYIGPWWLLWLSNASGEIYITHHDLGLIAPLPSQITNEHQIPKEFTLRSWLSSTTSWQSKILTVYKYFLAKIIWNTLKNVNLHIVPSSFMKPHYEMVSWKEVRVFPHTLLD